MQIFADYITPLTAWLHAHPHWALFITFLVSFTESLAIIGSIVPGSVTMTAIGILAGSGVIPVDLTFIAAILGAIAGDSASYALGYFYRDKITAMWPFNRYPHWLILGKEYFAKHGGKSVLIGRFFGPLRSIIPIIAGMLSMQQWRFLLANVISAIGWSILYVTPGVLIGAATAELSAESATRLFAFILISLIALWLFSLGIKWILVRITGILQLKLHYFWLKIKGTAFYNFITPKAEINHFPSAILSLFFILNSLCLLIILVMAIKSAGVMALNQPIYLLLQSIRTQALDVFFIFCTQFISYITLIILFISIALWYVMHKNYRGFMYSCSILLINILFSYLLSVIIPKPWFHADLLSQSAFPALNLMLSTSLFTFLIGYINRMQTAPVTLYARYIFITLLVLAGIATLYLGIYRLTDVLIAYLTGSIIGLGHWIMYRRKPPRKSISAKPVILIFFILFLTTSLAILINYKTAFYTYAPTQDKYVLNSYVWWNQQQPLLPLYRNNRIGDRISLLNIQYLGKLELLRKKLQQEGWTVNADTLFTSLLKRTNSKTADKSMPIFSQLFENNPPILVMTYTHKHPKFKLVLRIWQSRYFIGSLQNQIWIGSIHQNYPVNKNKRDPDSIAVSDPLTWLLPALEGFTIRQVTIPASQLKPVAIPAMPAILLIKPHE